MTRRAGHRRVCAGLFHLTLVFLASLVSLPAAWAQSVSPEYAVKGAYLYKFVPFIDWPATAFSSPASPLTICIFGHDPFGPGLNQMVAAQKESARPMAVRRIQALDEIGQCQEIFVDNTNPQAAIDLLHAIDGRPILTVTDSSLPSDGDGIIGFVIDGNHVRFKIDNASAARSNLIISSKLLGLATSVKARKAAP